jgi:hypothetical protein
MRRRKKEKCGENEDEEVADRDSVMEVDEEAGEELEDVTSALEQALRDEEERDTRQSEGEDGMDMETED